MSASAILGGIALAYPIVESLIHERNAKKASALRKELNLILAKYNLKIADLRSELERRGVSYNLLMDSLSGVSPVGRAAKIKQKAIKEYHDSSRDINKQINLISNKEEQISSLYNQQAEDLESKGILRTITGDFIK